MQKHPIPVNVYLQEVFRKDFQRLYNLVFELPQPLEVTSTKDHLWQSADHAGQWVCQAGKTYIALKVMPGYKLLGIVAETGGLHFLPANEFEITVSEQIAYSVLIERFNNSNWLRDRQKHTL